MADVFSKRKRSQVMGRIRSKDTKPEIALRRVLHAAGYRFRVHVTSLPGKPDIVLPKYKTAIQVRGCFWHGHTCIDGHIPKSRRSYWEPKLRSNKRRDARNDRMLRQDGWAVLNVWECRVQSKKGLERETARIRRFLDRRKGAM